VNIDLDDEYIENITFDELTVGQTARLVRTLSLQDIQAFAAVSGDTNPAHLDPKFADSYMYHQLIGHGMWSGSLISTLLGTIYLGQVQFIMISHCTLKNQ
jgi:phosphate acetyltransferase